MDMRRAIQHDLVFAWAALMLWEQPCKSNGGDSGFYLIRIWFLIHLSVFMQEPVGEAWVLLTFMICAVREMEVESS